MNAGGANAAAAATDSPPTEDAGAKPFAANKLEACFDNLANAAKAERTALKELVKALRCSPPRTANSWRQTKMRRGKYNPPA